MNRDLKEEVYIEQPPGFVANGESGKVRRLHKAIYGLKQSPRPSMVGVSRKSLVPIEPIGANHPTLPLQLMPTIAVKGIPMPVRCGHRS